MSASDEKEKKECNGKREKKDRQQRDAGMRKSIKCGSHLYQSQTHDLNPGMNRENKGGNEVEALHKPTIVQVVKARGVDSDVEANHKIGIVLRDKAFHFV